MDSKKEKRVLHDNTLLHYSWLNGREHEAGTSSYLLHVLQFSRYKKSGTFRKLVILLSFTERDSYTIFYYRYFYMFN